MIDDDCGVCCESALRWRGHAVTHIHVSGNGRDCDFGSDGSSDLDDDGGDVGDGDEDHDNYDAVMVLMGLTVSVVICINIGAYALIHSMPV